MDTAVVSWSLFEGFHRKKNKLVYSDKIFNYFGNDVYDCYLFFKLNIRSISWYHGSVSVIIIIILLLFIY